MYFWVFGGKRDLLNKLRKRKNIDRNSGALVLCFNKAVSWGRTSESALSELESRCMVAAWAATPLPRQPSLITQAVKTHYCSPNGGICPPAAVLACVLVCSGNHFWLARSSNITRTDAASCSVTSAGEVPWLHPVIAQPVWSASRAPSVTRRIQPALLDGIGLGSSVSSQTLTGDKQMGTTHTGYPSH